MIGKHGYLATPPPTQAARRRFVAALSEQGARFYGHGETAAGAERELGRVVGAWAEEREERSQAAWQGAGDWLRGE